MKSLLIKNTIVMLFYIISTQLNGQEVTKNGGLPESERWGENEVKNYLSFPVFEKLNHEEGSDLLKKVESKLKQLEKIGDYAIIGDRNIQKNDRGVESISFILKSENAEFEIIVNDSRFWSDEFDIIYNDITLSVELWNNIPLSYKVEKSDNFYALDSISLFPGRWYYDLEKNISISIFSKNQINEIVDQNKIIETSKILISETIGIIL